MTSGNLGLTDEEENRIVKFLETLSDGFTRPYLNSDTFTGSCTKGGSAATQGNEFLIPTPPLPPCASAICGVAPVPGLSLYRNANRETAGMPEPMHVFSWLVRFAELRMRGGRYRSELWRMAIHRGYVLLIVWAQSISLRCEHEQSASHTGDLGFERQPARSGKSNDSKSRAGTDHPRPYDRVGKGGANHYQVDNEQSRWLPCALRNRALRNGSEKPERDGKIADPVEPGSRIDGFPRAHRRPPAANNLLLHGRLDGS